jgi:zinc protease
LLGAADLADDGVMRRSVASKGILALALHVGCAGSGPSASLRDAELPWGTVARPGELGMRGVRFAIKQFRLPSGMMVVLERAPTRGMVGVVLTVAAGSAQDPPGKEGLAHYVEHLTYRAAPKNGKGTVDDELARLGATYNATTNPDFTRYFEFAPAASLPALLELVSRRLSTPIDNIDPRGAAVERDVVTNELRQRNHTGVYGQVLGSLQAAVFPADHPYSRPTIGTARTIAALTVADAQAFTAAHYRPGNATLVLVGEFPDDAAALTRMVQELPRPLLAQAAAPARPAFRRLGAAPPPPPGGAYSLKAAVILPEVWLAWPLPTAYGGEGHLVRTVTAPILSSILAGLLEDDRDVADVECAPVYARQATMLACGVKLWSASRRSEVAKHVAEGVGAVWSAPSVQQILAQKSVEELVVMSLSVRRLDAMRSRAFAQITYGAESYTERALARADHLAVLADASQYTQTIQKMIATKPSEISEFAHQYLTPERMRRVDVDPLPTEARPPVGLVRAAVDTPISLEVGTATDLGLPPRLPAPPELAGARRLKLDNGMTVVLVRRTDFPSVTVALGFPGGDALSEPPGVRDLVRRAQPPGSSSLPFNAVDVSGYDRTDMTTDVVRAGAGNLPTALALLVARLVRADELDWEKAFEDREGKGYVLRGDLPETKASREILAALYGGHPYGRLPTATERHAINAASVRNWLARTHQPRNARLVIVGDIELAAAESEVKTWFGPWRNEDKSPSAEVPPVPAIPTASPQEKIIITDRTGVPQTQLTVACRVPGDSTRDELIARSLAEVTAAGLSTRLRTEAGVTYGVSGDAFRLRGGAAHIVLVTAVDTTRLGEVMGLLRAHWKQYAERGFDGAALSQVRWSLSRREWMSMQTSRGMAMRLMDVLTTDGEPLEVGEVGQNIVQLSPADLQHAFAMCRASTVISLVGDEATLRRSF